MKSHKTATEMIEAQHGPHNFLCVDHIKPHALRYNTDKIHAAIVITDGGADYTVYKNNLAPAHVAYSAKASSTGRALPHAEYVSLSAALAAVRADALATGWKVYGSTTLWLLAANRAMRANASKGA